MSKLTMLLKSNGKNPSCYKKKKKKNPIIVREEEGRGGRNKIKTDATAKKCVLMCRDAERRRATRCSDARPHAGTANHSVVSTSSHDAPLSGRLRQSSAVGLRMHKY